MRDENRTSIPCSGGTRDVLKELKEERGQDWDSFLLDMAQEIESTDDNSKQFTYDDAVQANKQAIREELPDHIFK